MGQYSNTTLYLFPATQNRTIQQDNFVSISSHLNGTIIFQHKWMFLSTMQTLPNQIPLGPAEMISLLIHSIFPLQMISLLIHSIFPLQLFWCKQS